VSLCLFQKSVALTIGQIVPHFLGAAFTASAPAVPSWTAGFEGGNNIGGLISAVLAPTSGFGKLLTVLIALSVPSACAPTMYTFGTSFMTIAPIFQKVPRYVFAIISEAVLVPAVCWRFYIHVSPQLNPCCYCRSNAVLYHIC
jgi:purine-cytosine permease-like protein